MFQLQRTLGNRAARRMLDDAMARPVAHRAEQPLHQDTHDAPVQRTCSTCDSAFDRDPIQQKCAARDGVTDRGARCDEDRDDHSTQPPVQTKCAACAAHASDDAAMIRGVAYSALAAATSTLPHRDRIQRAFGHHDLAHVRAVIGGPATHAADEMGAEAFTSGSAIGFRESPDLRLAAHESAHVIQQRSGLQLPGNVGRRDDRWERHADQVADAVVAGRSAEGLLDAVAPAAAAVTPAAVQLDRKNDEHPS